MRGSDEATKRRSDGGVVLRAALDHWEAIARFAWRAVQEQGRGVVLVDRDDLLAAGRDRERSLPLSFVPASHIPRGDDFAALISRYDPRRQVALLIGGDDDDQLLILESAEGSAESAGVLRGRHEGTEARRHGGTADRFARQTRISKPQSPIPNPQTPIPTPHSPTRLVPARDRVNARLVRRARQFPSLGLEPLSTEGLTDRDAGLALALDHAVTRHWRALETVLSSCLSRPWSRLEPVVQAPLLSGAAQLLLMDRIPEHAAINESVAWTKTHGRAGAGGLVNAVLRRLAGQRVELVPNHDPTRRDELPLPDGGAWRLRDAVFDDDDALRLAQTTSHGDALIGRWVRRLGESEARRVAMHSLVQPPIIVAGGTGDPRLSPHDQAGFAVYSGPRGELRELLSSHRDARVQDPTAAAAVASTRALHPSLAVDLCAGRGTKTRQLFEIHPETRIVASDADEVRRSDLARTFDGHGRVTVVEPARLIDHAGQADLVLADVPCSNSGVLARRPEAKYRFDDASLESLCNLQRQLLAESIRLLAPGATLVYATCSLEPEENEEQTRWVARWHGLETAAKWSRQPAGQPGDPPGGYADGGFFAVLRGT